MTPRGKLDLDTPMVSFFPDRTIANLDERKARPTVRHLARVPTSTSFPSGHSASAFAFATGASLEMRSLRLPLTTLAAAAVILALAFWFRVREPVLGLLAIGAVGLVVAWVFGVMAAVGIPFNVMTAMVSALAIGIGVPYGIHVVNRFLEDRGRFDDLGDAVRSTLEHTGGALVGSAVTTMIGFGSLVLSAIPPFRQFGFVLALTIGLALVASVAVLPALLVVHARVRGRRLRRDAGGERDADRRQDRGQPAEARPLGSSSAPT